MAHKRERNERERTLVEDIETKRGVRARESKRERAKCLFSSGRTHCTDRALGASVSSPLTELL